MPIKLIKINFIYLSITYADKRLSREVTFVVGTFSEWILLTFSTMSVVFLKQVVPLLPDTKEVPGPLAMGQSMKQLIWLRDTCGLLSQSFEAQSVSAL